MRAELVIRTERLPLRAPFRISRGVKTHAEVVTAELRAGEIAGRGECVPSARYGETPASVAAALEALAPRIAAGERPADLVTELPPGAARNALDCAVWDLEARRTGVSAAA